MQEITIQATTGDKLFSDEKSPIKSRKLWYVIAKNEIRLRTSHFRRHRIAFFVILYGILLSWAFIIAPFLFNLLMPTIAAELADSFEPIIALAIEFMSMMLFLLMVMYPLSNLFRTNDASFKETLLSSPAKSGDIFMGEFLGKLPIYSMIVLLIAPIMVGIVSPILNLTIFHYAVIYLSILVMAYFANLIGTIIISWLEHKIMKSERARDWGKALIIILTILMVVIMYAAIFFFNEFLIHPEIKNLLVFYPSIWYSNLILHSINPALINTSFLNAWMSLILAAGVPLLTLIFSYYRSKSFYTLEHVSGKSKPKKEAESKFFLFIRSSFGKRWGGLVMIQLKRFLRKKANIARYAYVIGLAGFITWFLGRLDSDPFLIVLTSTVLIALVGGMNSIMIGHLAFVGSKDLLWVYKRSPRGIKGLVYSYLLSMLILVTISAAIITILYSIFANPTPLFSVFFFLELVIFAEISMCQAMGLQCINPAFGIKESKMKSNTMISMGLMQPLLLMPMLLIIFIGLDNISFTFMIAHGVTFLYNIVTSMSLLKYGLKKIERYE